MWTPDNVKARFLEAADIEHRMFVKGQTNGGNAWPSYRFDADDMAGWDDAARQDHLERWQGRKVAKSPELTRWEEVFFHWTLLIPERHRLLVWRYAQCLASGRSFSQYCENKGIVRRTAYDRVEKAFENLATLFWNDARLFRAPEGKWALQQDVVEASIGDTMDGVAGHRGPTVHKPFRTEKHRDMLGSAESVSAFSKHLSQVNDARRKARLRKALRGVPGEQEAA